MAKRRSNAPVATATQNETPAKTQPDVDESAKATPAVYFPIGPPDPGHCPRSVNTRISRRQGAALKAVFCQLRDTHEKCEMEGMSSRGKVVEEYTHAIRWLLDRVADAWEASTGEELLDNETLVF